MRRILKPFQRFTGWFSIERLAAFGAAFYGIYIWIFRSFQSSNAFNLFTVPISASGIPSEPIFAIPLIVGAALILVGIGKNRDNLIMLGALLSFFVFLSALISCLSGKFSSTGVPAYAILSSLYLTVLLRWATGSRWIPIR